MVASFKLAMRLSRAIPVNAGHFSLCWYDHLLISFAPWKFFTFVLSNRIVSRIVAHMKWENDQMSNSKKAANICRNLIAASIYDKYSIGPSTRPMGTRCCFKMTSLIQMCSNLHWARVFIVHTRPDEIVSKNATSQAGWGIGVLRFDFGILPGRVPVKRTDETHPPRTLP